LPRKGDFAFHPPRHGLVSDRYRLPLREQARSTEAQAESERISQLLADERQTVDTLRQELRQHPEQLARLSNQLAEAQANGATARGRRDALQDRVRDLERQVDQLRARRPEERGAAGTRSDLDALGNQLRGEIRDLARAMKDVQSPLPRILVMTREVRESVTGVQTSQRQASETLERLEKASESLAFTTDYLVALSEEEDDEEDTEDEDLDSEEELSAEAGVDDAVGGLGLAGTSLANGQRDDKARASVFRKIS